MKSALLSMFLALPLAAQTTPKPDPPVAVKSSPAQDALVEAAKDATSEQKLLNDALQQARASMDASQKDLQKQYQDAQKALMDKLKADKHYAPLLDNLNNLQKQIQDQGMRAQQAFQQQAGPIQSKIASDNALIQGLIPVVKKENSLPDSASFDPTTQTWKWPLKK